MTQPAEILQAPSSSRSGRWQFVLLSLVIVGAAVLRFWQLDSQLWFDEISALRGYRRSFLELLFIFPEYFPHPLYELMAHAAWVMFGETSWAIRFPAAVWGVVNVAVFYALLRRLLSRNEALLGAALLAVSYHHIFFSQNARGYTLYLCLALVATMLYWRWLEKPSWRNALAYAVVAALTAHSQTSGLVLALGHMLAGLTFVWLRRVRPSWVQVVALWALSAAGALLLYAPILLDAVHHGVRETHSGGRSSRASLMIVEALEGFRSAGLGGVAVVVGGSIGLVGVVDLFRRRTVEMVVLVTPLALAVLTALTFGLWAHPRYFILALPLGYLFAVHGLVILANYVAGRVLHLSPRVAVASGVAAAVLLVAATTIPLRRYYSLPKQDFAGALQYVRDAAKPGDRVVAADLAAFAIRVHYDPVFPAIGDVNALVREEHQGRRVWVITTLERLCQQHNPELFAHLQQHYRVVKVFPGTLGDGAMRIYLRDRAGKSDE